MAAFLVRRLAVSLLLVALVLTLAFFVIHLVPGDPAAVLVEDSRISAEHRAELRRAFGLDRPLAVQYAAWIESVLLRFDFGTSFDHQRPVREVLARFLPNTLLLAGTALAIQFSLGLALGVRAARRAGSRSDHAIRLVSLALYATPAFWMGLMALLLLSHALPLFPAGQMRSVGAEELSAWRRLLDLAHHLALPALVLGLATAGGVARLARASLLEALGQDYVRTARAKGLPPGRVVWVHALRNAVAPLIQTLGLALPILLSGSLVVEVVFAWPGLGWMMRDAIFARDYPVILAGTTLAALMVVAGSLAADLGHAAADPRVRADAG